MWHGCLLPLECECTICLQRRCVVSSQNTLLNDTLLAVTFFAASECKLWLLPAIHIFISPAPDSELWGLHRCCVWQNAYQHDWIFQPVYQRAVGADEATVSWRAAPMWWNPLNFNGNGISQRRLCICCHVYRFFSKVLAGISSGAAVQCTIYKPSLHGCQSAVSKTFMQIFQFNLGFERNFAYTRPRFRPAWLWTWISHVTSPSLMSRT